jgi:hypothetical protein
MEYISLGSNCSITYQLSKLGLRKCAYPFDWTKITLSQLISILVEDFNDYSKSLEFVSISNIHPIIEAGTETNYNDLTSSSSLILTNKYKIKFAHELGEKYQLDEFKNRLEDRIKRFRELGDKDICFVRIELSPLNQSWYSNIMKLHSLLFNYSYNFKLILIICSHTEFQFPPNIKIYKFDKFDPDWKMDTLDWNNIFSL